MPFSDRPKILENLGCLFFFFFSIFNFVFLNKIVKIKVSKYIVIVPKVYCEGTEGIGLSMHVSTRLFDVTYLNTENYMHFSNIQIQEKKKKKKKDRPPTLPIFRPKGQTNLYFFQA